jgi:hypothetical protein
MMAELLNGSATEASRPFGQLAQGIIELGLRLSSVVFKLVNALAQPQTAFIVQPGCCRLGCAESKPKSY